MENLSCMHKALGLILNIKWNNKRSKKPFDSVSATSCSNLTSVFLAQNMNVLKESTGSLPNLCTQRHSYCWSKTSVAIRSGSRDLCCSPRLHSDRLAECDHSYRPLWSCHFDKCFQLTAIPAALTSLAPGQAPEMLLLSQGSLSVRWTSVTPRWLWLCPQSQKTSTRVDTCCMQSAPWNLQGNLKRERKTAQVSTAWESRVSARATASGPVRLSSATSFFKEEPLHSPEGWGFQGLTLRIWTDQGLTYCKEGIDEGMRNTLRRIIIHEVATHQ